MKQLRIPKHSTVTEFINSFIVEEELEEVPSAQAYFQHDLTFPCLYTGGDHISIFTNSWATLHLT